MSPSSSNSSRDHEATKGSNGVATKLPTDPVERVSTPSEVTALLHEHDGQQRRSWRRNLDPLKTKRLPPVPMERGPSPEYNSGILSSVYFNWLSPLLAVGYQRPLELNDIWTVNPRRSVNILVPQFRQALQARKAAAGKLNPLGMALIDTLKSDFVIGGLCQLAAAVLQIMTRFTLRFLLDFAAEAYRASFDGGQSPSIGRGVGIVFALTGMQLVQSLCTNSSFYRESMVGAGARSVLITCICSKSIRLANRAKAHGKDGLGSEDGWNNGRITNLMSTDTSRIDQASQYFHRSWTCPVQILLTLALLCVNLGYSALAGFVFICIMTPLLGRAISSLMSRRRKINKANDRRVRLLQEIIASIRFIKLFAWESSFLDQLAEARRSEVHEIFKLLTIQNGLLAISIITPVFAAILTFVTYRLTGHPMTPARIFSSLALFNTLSTPLEYLPRAIGKIVDGAASLKRLSEFFDAEEQADTFLRDLDGEHAIAMRQASFTWELSPTQTLSNKPSKAKAAQDVGGTIPASATIASNSRGLKDASVVESVTTPSESLDPQTQDQPLPFQIKGFDISIGRRELIAVIGSVGSGKSSLLDALAGEMRQVDGSVTFGGTCAYCPQYAWIQNASIKNNILFGRKMDPEWYAQVVEACGLLADFDLLPHGDETEVGERGITLSGGQKQRVNVARAIYFGADVLLMDDPLSAVDAHVGRHIMDRATCGLLSNKCRILATHQLHVLHRADRVIWMKDGSIHQVGTYKQLVETNAEFQKMMENVSAEDKEPLLRQQVLQDQTVVKEADKNGIKQADRPATLMRQEDRATGNVKIGVYYDYIKATRSMWNLLVVAIVVISSQVANIFTSLWLSWWTSNRCNLPLRGYIGVYVALGAVHSFLLFCFAVFFSYFGTKASRIMLHDAVSSTLQAPSSFFDTTPVGRIMNRFSKDVDTMDNNLPGNLRMLSWILVSIFSVLGLTIAYYYWFAVALLPLCLLFIYAAAYYRASAREIKRHEAVLRSEVFSRFGEIITGTSTIRAFGVQSQFEQSVAAALNSTNGAYLLTYAIQRWLSIRLDTVGILLVFIVGMLVVTSRFSVDPSIGGVVFSYILSIVRLLQLSVRQVANVETNMNATERLHYYSKHLEKERFDGTCQMRPSWPEKGHIVFEDIQLRYRTNLPLVLNGLTASIQPGERIGIVGRTGAGKSSLITALFRLVELSGGSISIDGVDIATVDLHTLRRNLAVVPQDPTLFRGTIRSNLDPFSERKDPDLWHALRRAGLVDTEQPQEQNRLHLDSPVDDEGLNFSLGQRQLLALARVLVKNSRIIICDEATSSVDFETDRRIQRTMLKAFAGKTLLCVAHRLNTVIG